jgi:hypothetical protein
MEKFRKGAKMSKEEDKLNISHISNNKKYEVVFLRK